MDHVNFLCPPELEGRIPAPAPASKFLPDWFRALPREMGMPDAHGLPALTVRACLPVADVMAQGWIIPTPFDVWTSRHPDFGTVQFHWDADAPFAAVEAHHPAQIGATEPPFLGAQPYKLINPWRVVVPPGWSVTFLHPVNHFELPFTAFGGTVDCDALDVPVNVPMLWTAPHVDVRMPAGTPMVQVVPFERAAQAKTARVRAETPDEAEARRLALTRKYTEESLYARQWRRRHEKDQPT